MRSASPVSVLFVATASAALHGAIAVFAVPLLSFVYLINGAGRPGNNATEFGMTVAVLAPLAWAAAGFVMGAMMSSLFNLFVKQEARPRVIVEHRPKVRAAAVVDAA